MPSRQNFSSLTDLWGWEVELVTVRDLLAMRSGIPDYDTASPSGGQMSDSFRAYCYDHPTISFTPTQLMSVPWCATGKLLFLPGTQEWSFLVVVLAVVLVMAVVLNLLWLQGP